MKMTRRGFLKTLGATAPAAAASGASSLLSSGEGEAEARPRGAPVVLEINDAGFLIEPDFYLTWEEPEMPMRSDYYGFDCMDLREQADFLFDWSRLFDERLLELAGTPLKDWAPRERAYVEAVVASQRSWLNEQIDLDELSARDLARESEYGAAVEIFHALGPKETRRLGLREGGYGGPASDAYGIRYAGDPETLTKEFAALGVNAVVRGSGHSDDPG